MSLAIVDIDGTLVDTNYHHTVAWWRAFARIGIDVPAWRLHRHIGMGGDQLIAAVAGDDAEREHGDEIREVEGEIFSELIDEVAPLEGARELLSELKRRGHTVILASSAKEEEADHYLDLLEARELVDGWTTSADIESTKPEPDLIAAAREKAPQEDEAVMIGDTVWDIEAAKRDGVETIAVLSGGFSRAELEQAGAVTVFEGPAELCERLGETNLA
jgi:HAD superfamily hydrolase (TIGR01509 family)